MKYHKPDYYDAFTCAADQCPDTCCEGWQIVIDEDSYRKYLELDGEFGNRMLESLNHREMCFHQCNGRCAFLNEQNLCDLIIEKGPEYLCDTCARYPRHIEEFEGVREYSLSLSCPIAAELILDQKGFWKFREEQDALEDPLAEEFEEFDYAMYGVLEDARDVIWQVLRQEQLSMGQRMTLIVYLASTIQELVDEGNCLESYELLEQFHRQLQVDAEAVVRRAHTGLKDTYMGALLQQEGPEYFHALKASVQLLESLERLRPEWTEVLEQCSIQLLSPGQTEHDSLRQAFHTYLGEQGMQELENYRKNIVLFFLYTYFCGAVYDDMVFSKVALAIFSMIFLEETVMCRWILADKKIEKADYVRLSYRYAREVEHSDENLIALEEWLMDQYEPVKEENGFEAD